MARITPLNLTVTVFIVILLAVILYLFSDIFILLSVSVLLAIILNPLVTFLERRYFNRSNSSLIVFASLTIVFYFSLSVLIPSVISQVNSLTEILGQISLKSYIAKIDKEVSSAIPFLPAGMISKKFEAFVSSAVNSTFDQLASMATNIFALLGILVIIPFTTFFIVKDKSTILKALLNITPNKYFEMSYWVIKKITSQLGRYVRGWLFDAFYVGAACGIGFWFIGLDNALALGILAGVGHLIPYFGPLVGGVPAIAIATIQYGNFSMLPLIILILLIVYITDNGFVQPFVFSKSVNMHPLMIILLIVAGSQVGGIIGMLLAVPLATVIKTAAKEIYLGVKDYRIARM